MTVYLDEMFFYSFLIDAVILESSALLLRKKAGVRIVLGASFGALFDCVSFFWETAAFLPFRLVVAAIMLLISFGRSGTREFSVRLAVFLIVSFISAGVMTAVVYLGGAEAVIYNGSVYMRLGRIKWLLAAMLCAPFSVWGIRKLRSKIDRQIYRAKIKLGEKEIETELLADTGNCLRDPIGGKPVIVAEWEVMKGLFPEAVSPSELVKSGGCFRIRAIPFRAVGAEGTLMSVDTEVEILDENKYIGEVPVAIVEKPLSKSGEYHGLLQSELL